MSAYLDASALLPTLPPEAAQQGVFAFLSTTPETLTVSDFAAAEVSSVFSGLVWMGALTLVTLWDGWPISTSGDPPRPR